VFDCKPLAVLWGKYPGVYTRENTIMLDDLRRNYVMNRQNGLVIRPFRKVRRRSIAAGSRANLLYDDPRSHPAHCLEAMLRSRACSLWDSASPPDVIVVQDWCAAQAHLTRSTDRELLYLKLYLLKIAELDSLSTLRHSRWESYIADELRAVFGDDWHS